jgi:hypothetical protein
MLKKVILYATLILSSLTVYGQSGAYSSKDSVRCFTIPQQRAILDTLAHYDKLKRDYSIAKKEIALKDTIIAKQGLIIKADQDFITESRLYSQFLENVNKDLLKKNEKLDKKLRRSRQANKIFIITTTVLSAVLIIVLL